MSKNEATSGAKTFLFFQNTKVQLFIISITAFLLYARVVQFGYIGFDDTRLIVDNQSFLQDLSNIPQAFQQDIFNVPGYTSPGNYYRPFLTLSFMLDAQTGKSSPKIYHFTNVVLHVFASLLLLYFLRFMKLRPEAAFLLTMIFTVHPILSQAVGWIPGRNDTLLALFVLLSMIFFLKYEKTSKTSSLLLHLFFFMPAVLTKESAVFLPAVTLYYSTFLSKGKSFSKKLAFMIPGYLTIIIFWWILRDSALPEHRTALSLPLLSERFFENLPLLLQYLTKIIIPFRLSTFSSAMDTNYILGAAAMTLLVSGILLSSNKDWKRIVFGLLWFLVFLLPSFVALKITGLEHRVYLPLAGLLIVFSELNFVKAFRPGKLNSLVAAVLILLLISVNVRHTVSFKNRLNFWKTAAEASPHSSLAYLNYGAALDFKGDYDKALSIYKEGIKINPNEPMIHNNLALIYHRKKMFAEAEKEFYNEIRINPNYIETYYNIGLLYRNMGLIPKAIRMWERALEINPNHHPSKTELFRFRN